MPTSEKVLYNNADQSVGWLSDLVPSLTAIKHQKRSMTPAYSDKYLVGVHLYQ